MAWKQTMGFDLGKMGTTPGMCLQNVRVGYGIGPKYASARDAMNASKREGTFHEGLDIPTDVAVPIFAETGSPYAHVMVDYYGDVYSDGKHLSTLKDMIVLGWSETLNDARVVEWVEEPAPAPAPEPTPEPAPAEERFKEGDVVEAKVTTVDKKNSKVTLSIKALEIEEEKKTLEEYSSATGNSALGDALGEALKKNA